MDKKSGTPKRFKQKSVYAGKDEFFDGATGEKIGERIKYRTQAVKAKFITMYLDDENFYEFISGLGNTGKVLGYIMRDFNDKSGMFYFSSSVKDMMVDTLKISIGTIRSCVRDFAEKRTILHVSGSEYMVNPYIFYKGHSENHQNLKDSFDGLCRVQEAREANKRIDAKTVKV